MNRMIFRYSCPDPAHARHDPVEVESWLVRDRCAKRFGIPHNKTQILIYDKESKLRDVETDLSDEKTVVHRVKAISNELLAE